MWELLTLDQILKVCLNVSTEEAKSISLEVISLSISQIYVI